MWCSIPQTPLQMPHRIHLKKPYICSLTVLVENPKSFIPINKDCFTTVILLKLPKAHILSTSNMSKASHTLQMALSQNKVTLESHGTDLFEIVKKPHPVILTVYWIIWNNIVLHLYIFNCLNLLSALVPSIWYTTSMTFIVIYLFIF